MRYTMIATVVALSIGHEVCAGNVVLYVEDDAPPNGDGASWDTAFRFLQDALAVASEPENGIGLILVAEGTYAPDRDEVNPDGTGDREATFQIPNRVAVLGGFPGAGAENANVRDAGLYETILSGDLLGDDGLGGMNVGENSYHVVTIINANSGTQLDGFTVTAGNADSGCCEDDRGAGIVIEEGVPQIVDCLVASNRTVGIGAGIKLDNSNALISGCMIENNEAASAAGIHVGFGAPRIEGCVFSENLITTPTGAGAGLVCVEDSTVVDNCEFHDNEAGNGGAIQFFRSQATLLGCLFVGNVAGADGGSVFMDGGSVTIMDGMFADNTAGSKGGAIWLDPGTNGAIISCDFEGNSADDGGAIYYHSPGTAVFVECRFTANEALRGGAVNNDGDPSGETTPVFLDCEFTANDGGVDGGAVYNSRNSGLFLNCTFEDNTGGDGVGIYNSESDPTVLGCLFRNNVSLGRGGAVGNVTGSEPTFVHCSFVDNTCLNEGGAIYSTQSDARFYYCRMLGNHATRDGGAIYNDRATPVVENCLFSGNRSLDNGGAIYGLGDMTIELVNCTLAGNRATDFGGGIINDDLLDGGHITLLNCILWGNIDVTGGGESAQVVSSRADSITVNYSDIEGWTGLLGGVGNIGVAPLFVDADGPDDEVGTEDDNLQLLGGSPCIDAADTALVSACHIDLALAERQFDDPATRDTGAGRAPIVDMGVFEFASPAAPDCNLNGRIDLCDIADGDALDCNGNLVPDDCDIAEGQGVDCNSNGVPDDCELERGDAFDCNLNGTLDECDFSQGVAMDCNVNGIPDSCDIAAGASSDCNDNGVPDECDTGLLYVVDSGELSPIGDGSPQSFTLFGPPQPTGLVNITLTAFGDFGSSNEWIDLKLNGAIVATLLKDDGQSCPAVPDVVISRISADVFDDLVAGGDAVFTLATSFDVDPDECRDPSFVSLSLEYPVLPSSRDRNGNQIPDECDALSDLDGDGMVGTSDLILLLGAWGRCDDCQDCLGDIDGDCAVGTSDLIILLGNWG